VTDLVLCVTMGEENVIAQFFSKYEILFGPPFDEERLQSRSDFHLIW